MTKLSPGVLANMELAAERSLQKAIADCDVVGWMKRWTDKGLAPRALARMMLGRKSKAARQREKEEKARKPKPSAWSEVEYK